MTDPCPAHSDVVVRRDAASFADTAPEECSPMDPMDCSEPQVCFALSYGQVCFLLATFHSIPARLCHAQL